MSKQLSEIPVFYSPEMTARVESMSPSAEKPARLVESWQMQCLPISIHAPAPVTREDFYRVHDRGYVEGIFALRRRNGFGNRSAEVAASLPYTSGAMLAAARAALDNRQVAVAPCSGFHHAHHAASQGFCTFNGLMVTAAALRAGGECRRIGILDCDQHYGNGTDHIIGILGAQDWIRHCTTGADLRSPGDADAFLEWLPSAVRKFSDCDVLLYQAGADPHIDDPLGGWMTTQQLWKRDMIVFTVARELGLPVAWNLAGGYQKPLAKVLAIHTNTLDACVRVYLGKMGQVP